MEALMMGQNEREESKRVVRDDTVTLDSEAREVAMRTAFVKTGRYLVRRGENLNTLLKEVFR
jgi:hypothetical protein